MATKKPAGPERVHSKSYNGAARGTALQHFDSPVNDRFFGSSFVLVAYDHHPQPVWSSTKFIKKAPKDDVYESWRAKPEAVFELCRSASAAEFARACAAIGGGQATHHDAPSRWVGLARAHGLEGGTRLLLAILDRADGDAEVRGMDEAAVALPGDYNKTDFRYGPRVIGRDVVARLRRGLERFWETVHGGAGTPVAAVLDPDTLALARRVLTRHSRDGAAVLDWPLDALSLGAVFGGTNRDFNERCGLTTEHPMVMGTGY